MMSYSEWASVCVLLLWMPLAALGGVSSSAYRVANPPDSGTEPVSELARPGPDGRLIYGAYANHGDSRYLNNLPDWSRCGYMGGGVRIPEVPVKMVIRPMAGRDMKNIQAALDHVASLPVDSNGFRGTVLLEKGTYLVPGTLRISKSGVVLRGCGQLPERGTKIVNTGRDQDTLIVVQGGPRTESPGTRTPITDPFVPVGARSFRVQSARPFPPGTRIIVHRQTNDRWIDDLAMRPYGWTASGYEDKWERTVTAVDEDRVTLDAPIVQAIDRQYGGGSIYRYAPGGRIAQVGIENLWLESEFASDVDEAHGWNAVQLRHVENAWVRQVTARYFGYSCVSVGIGARHVTVEDCACLDPKSQITGGRRYSFNMDDCCFVLVQRCFARGGRHDFVTGSRVPGPNAFVDCTAVQCHSDAGPHHRYAEGTLFDNIRADRLHVENRRASGSGHGWSGAQTLFWNCEARTVCHTPLGAMNWAIGIVGPRAISSFSPNEPPGWWDSHGRHVTPRSLYYRQLQDRLGPQAVENVTTPAQRAGPIHDQLIRWAGLGRLEDLLPNP